MTNLHVRLRVTTISKVLPVPLPEEGHDIENEGARITLVPDEVDGENGAFAGTPTGEVRLSVLAAKVGNRFEPGQLYNATFSLVGDDVTEEPTAPIKPVIVPDDVAEGEPQTMHTEAGHPDVVVRTSDTGETVETPVKAGRPVVSTTSDKPADFTDSSGTRHTFKTMAGDPTTTIDTAVVKDTSKPVRAATQTPKKK
jgi:hypothetical protein